MKRPTATSVAAAMTTVGASVRDRRIGKIRQNVLGVAVSEEGAERGLFRLNGRAGEMLRALLRAEDRRKPSLVHILAVRYF